MARFYGWNLADIEALDYEDFNQYWLAITMIEAQEALVTMTLSDYPNMKDKDRKKLHKDMHSKAYFKQEERVVKVEDLQNIFGMGDISQVIKAKDKAKNGSRSNSNPNRLRNKRSGNV